MNCGSLTGFVGSNLIRPSSLRPSSMDEYGAEDAGSFADSCLLAGGSGVGTITGVDLAGSGGTGGAAMGPKCGALLSEPT